MVSAAMKLKKTLDPWKKTYDQLRQQIKKQRHYFATKVPSSQSYDFSSSHVWLWELDHRESWIPKDWYHPTISPSVIPFSSCLQSFPASGSFSMSQFFTSGSQSIGASASASVLPMNFQDWSPLGLTGLISLQAKGLSRVPWTPWFKSINSLALSFLHSPTLTSIHDYWKSHSFN